MLDLKKTMRPLLLALLVVGLAGCSGSDQPLGEIEGQAHSKAEITARVERQRTTAERLAAAENATAAKQILFGDLHVHTTYSVDAFAMEMPFMGQQGIHTPPDACDFARYCSSLDFFSFNDHAENLTPEHWAATKDTVRQCNALAGDPSDPDLVVFAGWEWTQVGVTPETHWGHKNIIFPDTDEASLPVRPISARERGSTVGNLDSTGKIVNVGFLDPLNWSRYRDLGWLLNRINEIPDCPPGIDSKELPLECNEYAPTPDALYDKLAQWGLDHLIIPHGNAWGFYTPAGASWDKSLSQKQHDPEHQTLIEVMSGHGNSEEFRTWDHVAVDDNGEAYCPMPTDDFLPCCWQAGEIMRKRCDGLSEAECDKRVDEARQLALEAGNYPHEVFPDAAPEEWLNCGQCTDCFKPAFSLRPKESTQYAMALSNFDEPTADGDPLRFKFGFIASTDDHTARPGTGYKQYERRKMTFATGVRSEFYDSLKQRKPEDPQKPQVVDSDNAIAETERAASFSFPGGVVAVHSEGRSRQEIWSALKRKEVYGTSGPRILLWFDLLNGSDKALPMGAETAMATTPRFRVRAAGDFVQLPGCPAPSTAALSPERLDYLCANECYNPSDQRHPIEAIEVVRIRPQQHKGEPIAPLIEDPWRRFECEPNANGCVVEFEDADFDTAQRDTLYYVRAIQEATPAINGDTLRTQYNDAGEPVSIEPCYGSYRTDFNDDCLAPANERAWSSPIFVNYDAKSATSK